MATSKNTDKNGFTANPPVPQESFGLPGKTYPVSANAVKTTTFPKQNKTKRLAGLQGPSNFQNKSNLDVALMAASIVPVARAGVPGSNLIRRAVNTLAQRQVVVHATGDPVEGTHLLPRAGSPGSPDKPVVFSWSTDFTRPGYMPKKIARYYKPYDQKWIASEGETYGNKGAAQQNFVIGRTSKTNLTQPELEASAIKTHPNPVKIVDVVQKPLDNLDDFVRSLKAAGVKTEPNAAEKLARAIADRFKAAKLKKIDKNSPV